MLTRVSGPKRRDQMKKSPFSEEQITYALRQVEAGTAVAEVCRQLGISEQTFYRWKRKFAGMRLSAVTSGFSARAGGFIISGSTGCPGWQGCRSA
jgi:transposase-like protein